MVAKMKALLICTEWPTNPSVPLSIWANQFKFSSLKTHLWPRWNNKYVSSIILTRGKPKGNDDASGFSRTVDFPGPAWELKTIEIMPVPAYQIYLKELCWRRSVYSTSKCIKQKIKVNIWGTGQLSRSSFLGLTCILFEILSHVKVGTCNSSN